MSGQTWSEREMDALRSAFPKSPWLEVLKALPARSRVSINQQARIHGVRREVNKRAEWTDPEVSTLRSLWPIGEPAAIMAALPGRRWNCSNSGR